MKNLIDYIEFNLLAHQMQNPFNHHLSNYQKAYGMPVSSDSDESDSDSSDSMFTFYVKPWGDMQRWHLCVVHAKDEEECVDFLNRRFSGSIEEIEEAVSDAKRLELKDSNEESGIIEAV